MRDVDNSADVLDSRDVQERIEELEAERGNVADLAEEVGDAETAYNQAMDDESESERQDRADELAAARQALREAEGWAEANPDDAEELAALLAFKAEAEDYCEWDSGETLIRESYWVEYVEELVSDIGDMPREIPSYIAIDWDKTAANIKADYTEAEFDGVTYYLRMS